MVDVAEDAVAADGAERRQVDHFERSRPRYGLRTSSGRVRFAPLFACGRGGEGGAVELVKEAPVDGGGREQAVAPVEQIGGGELSAAGAEDFQQERLQVPWGWNH